MLVLVLGLALGVVIGWLAGRPALSRAQSALERERAVHAERLSAYQDAETKLREAFAALTADALTANNRQFLDLAETRLQQSRAETAADIDARKKAIEDLLAPMARTLDQVE